MKKVLLAAAGLSVSSLVAHAADDDAHCSVESLRGTYAYAYEAGVATLPSSTLGYAPVAASGSGMEYYDGKGHMKYHEFYSDGNYSYTYTGTGSYKINQKCIATVIYEYDGSQSGNPWTYIVNPNGTGYFWNNNQNNGVISAGRVVLISTADLVE